MPTSLQDLTSISGLSVEQLALIGLAIGVFVFVYGLSNAFAGPTPQQRRLQAIPGGPRRRASGDVLRLDDNDPKGMLRALVPKTHKERSDIAKRLRQAGIHRKNAVQWFYMLRTVLALALPAAFIGLVYLPSSVPLPAPVQAILSSLSWGQTFFIMSGLVLIGFFTPSLWLKSKIDERRQKIEQSLPNALDLLVVAVEAGLGFDAAMTRVAYEISPVAPALADEFTVLQLELQAGKDRSRAFLDMVERSGVDEVASFANVVLQSVQFGTSISDALSSYATEMRVNRELRAQEKANKLPVKMSAILAGLMMPVLLIICLTPILIRWMRMFAEI